MEASPKTSLVVQMIILNSGRYHWANMPNRKQALLDREKYTANYSIVGTQ